MSAALQTLRYARSDALDDLRDIACCASAALLLMDPTSVYVHAIRHKYDEVTARLSLAQAEYDAAKAQS